MIYSSPQLARVMQIPLLVVNIKDVDETDLLSNFYINWMIICDFIGILMVKKGIFHSILAQWRTDDVTFDAFFDVR